MIFHKDRLIPPAVKVETRLLDADNKVGILVTWWDPRGGVEIRHSGRWAIDGFSTQRAFEYFQDFADGNLNEPARQQYLEAARNAFK